MEATIFSKKLDEYITQLTTIIKGEATPLPKNQTKSGLINLSPFPLEDWPLAQRQAATQAYGEITNWNFPVVSPTLDSQELATLVDDYYRKILAARPNAVHIIGEMNFTFRLIERLKAVDITCIASVWNGENSNDLYDELASEFVQFRVY